MLYITTRSKHDVYTPARTMNMERGDDGGLFVPYRMPEFSRAEILTLAGKTFGENVAEILNLLFSTKLTGWDVDMAIGRSPVKIKPMNHRILIAEQFHNMDWDFRRVVRTLADCIHPDGHVIGAPTNWTEVAIRIAVIFAIYGDLLRTEQVSVDKPVNIALASGSFAAPMAVWYARRMGLPVGTIICGCNENGAPWDLLHRGEVDTAAVKVNTMTHECDYAIPPHLERLICGTLGQDEAMNYCWSCTERTTYAPPEAAFEELRKGMFAAVVSHVRVETIIPSVYRTVGYVLDPYAALAYGALSDYRSRTGISGTAVLLSEKSPVCNGETVAKTMRITVSELKKRLSEV